SAATANGTPIIASRSTTGACPRSADGCVVLRNRVAWRHTDAATAMVTARTPYSASEYGRGRTGVARALPGWGVCRCRRTVGAPFQFVPDAFVHFAAGSRAGPRTGVRTRSAAPLGSVPATRRVGDSGQSGVRVCRGLARKRNRQCPGAALPAAAHPERVLVGDVGGGQVEV